MTHQELRKLFVDFFQEPPRNHREIPGSSLIPQNDPTVLFTTAGMHPLVPYLLGEPHPEGHRLVDCQKCLRTNDILEVGDAIHHTFFEMFGNWSLGDYFKETSIPWSFEFLIKVLKLDANRLYITCFAGDGDAPKDTDSAAIWESVGIPKDRIFFYGKSDNWWGPAGQTGPCGPDTEMHYDVTRKPHGPNCRPGDGCPRFSEIWNNVFMEYNKTADGTFIKLPKPNVDTGMGLERTLAVVNNLNDDYRTELWWPAIEKIADLTGKKYEDNLKSFRIITDHIRAATFVISAGIVPSNKEHGYILRRLIRRSVIQAKRIAMPEINSGLREIANVFIEIMSPIYSELIENKNQIYSVQQEEIARFEKTLDKGLKEFNKLETLTGKAAFDLFQTYGFPWEITAELSSQKGQPIDYKEFEKEFKNHQELSRTASAGMFKGGLADHSEISTKYHTATHLLHAALRQVLGDHVHQEGSNITAERLRFDFSHPQKLTPEEIKKVEDIVNAQITADLPRKMETMSYDEAIKTKALAFFKERYPEKVTVYSFGHFTREICGGPHVDHTGVLGKFRIIKEESVAAGTRRIYGQISEH